MIYLLKRPQGRFSFFSGNSEQSEQRKPTPYKGAALRPWRAAQPTAPAFAQRSEKFPEKK